MSFITIKSDDPRITFNLDGELTATIRPVSNEEYSIPEHKITIECMNLYELASGRYQVSFFFFFLTQQHKMDIFNSLQRRYVSYRFHDSRLIIHAPVYH